jgi:[ribosomal protein S5]-alanine N-acetyltransferase
MELLTLRLCLREFRESDFGAVRAYHGNPEMYRFEKGVLSEERTRAFLQTAQNQAGESPRTRYDMAVTVRPEAIVIGSVSLELLHLEIREWEIGWYIHAGYWGQGYATEAARAMLEYGFKELRAHRVVAFCHVLNAQSVRVMQKLGMQRDGVLREARRWNGAWSDEYVYAILDRAWPGEVQ